MVAPPAIWYIAVKKFDASAGEHWLAYRRWRQLPHLQEVISLDNTLCPSVIEEFTAEDWQHNVREDYLIEFFTDIEYLRSRLAEPRTVNVLAVLREPTPEAVSQFADPRFVFQGYDLIEQPGRGVSLITNRGGFEMFFKPPDISAVGLLTAYDLARGVQQYLLDCCPDEPHARSHVWAIWQMQEEK